MQGKMMFYMCEKGVSFEKLAASIGVDEEYLKDFAAGKVDTITVGSIRKICEELEQPVECIFL